MQRCDETLACPLAETEVAVGAMGAVVTVTAEAAAVGETAGVIVGVAAMEEVVAAVIMAGTREGAGAATAAAAVAAGVNMRGETAVWEAVADTTAPLRPHTRRRPCSLQRT